MKEKEIKKYQYWLTDLGLFLGLHADLFLFISSFFEYIRFILHVLFSNSLLIILTYLYLRMIDIKLFIWRASHFKELIASSFPFPDRFFSPLRHFIRPSFVSSILLILSIRIEGCSMLNSSLQISPRSPRLYSSYTVYRDWILSFYLSFFILLPLSSSYPTLQAKWFDPKDDEWSVG